MKPEREVAMIKVEQMLENSTLLITGGTGSFGNTLLRKIFEEGISIGEVRIFSRDEKKQDEMRKSFDHPKVKFYIGDVRDKDALKVAVKGSDFIFHAAALKQVPSTEFFPMEAIKTNCQGSSNIMDLSIECGVRKVVCLSTDKAVYPINVMGMTKALMEKIAFSKSFEIDSGNQQICITRYGNVIASRGSVIPLFLRQIRENRPLTITDPQMTRFMMSLPEAIDLVLHAFSTGDNGDLFVQKSAGASTLTIAMATAKLLGYSDYPINIIGTRQGEKLHEVLVSAEEKSFAQDQGRYFRIPRSRVNLDYSKFTDEGSATSLDLESYSSANTVQLSIDELVEKLGTLNLEKVFGDS